MSLSLDKQSQLALLAVNGIGRRTVRKIGCKLAQLGATWGELWSDSTHKIWDEVGLSEAKQLSLKKFQQRLTPEDYFGWLGSLKIKVISIEDKEYPKFLKEIDDKPLFLYVKGDISGANDSPIAVVGTRRISGYGRLVCEQIVPNLVKNNSTIISGFMYGVDQEAHQQAVLAQGRTIGILGYGFNEFTRGKYTQLAEKIFSNQGGFITEYPPWIRGNRGNFPERNRIVAGMSLAIVVVEAGQKSGSHITASLAAEYGRGVCAVPGPITNPYSEGTKWLVNQGARLVTSATEILEEAGLTTQVKQSNQDINLTLDDPLQQQIYQLLLTQSLTTDELARQVQVKISDLNIALSLLELEGYLVKKAESWFVKSGIKS